MWMQKCNQLEGKISQTTRLYKNACISIIRSICYLYLSAMIKSTKMKRRNMYVKIHNCSFLLIQDYNNTYVLNMTLCINSL